MSTDMSEMLQYVKVDNDEALGKLLCEYALGYHLRPDGTRPPLAERRDVNVPKDLEEFKAELQHKSVGSVHPRVKKLTIVKAEPDHFVMVLPPRDVAEATIAEFENAEANASYKERIAPFYEKMILNGRPWPEQEGMEHLPFWYCRVCDYTTSLCG